MWRYLKLIFVVLALSHLCPLAYAEDAPKAKNWEFNLAPMYLWAVKMDGEMTVRDQAIPLKLDFDEIFDTVEAVFTVHFEGLHKRKWGFLFDFSYVNIGDSITTPGPGGATIDVDFENILVELGVIYRFYDKSAHAFEALGGVRYTDLDAEIDIVGGPPPVPRKAGGKQEWLDPIIGLRYKWQISDKWVLSLRGDIGGFGIGDASDFTWNAAGLITWHPWKHVGFIGGYRALDQDYETGSGVNTFKYDMLIHGPVIAVNIKW